MMQALNSSGYGKETCPKTDMVSRHRQVRPVRRNFGLLLVARAHLSSLECERLNKVQSEGHQENALAKFREAGGARGEA